MEQTDPTISTGPHPAVLVPDAKKHAISNRVRWAGALTAAFRANGKRTALALGIGVAVIAVGILHITVWNPLARVPGVNLDQIYGAMAAADESPAVAQVLVWALFWGVTALVFVVLASIPRLYPGLTARMIVVVGFLLVGVTAFPPLTWRFQHGDVARRHLYDQWR